MASWPPKKNQAFVLYVGLISQADTKLLQANPTLAAGDVKVATDDGVPANLATLPVVDADFTDRVKVSMSAGEMNGDRISVIFSDAAGAEWADLFIDIPTSVRQIDDLAFPTTSGRSTDVLATGEVPIDFDTSIGSLAAAQIEASALDGKGDWNIGKTGYSLSQVFPSNFSDMSIVVGSGLVNITQAAADKVWSTATRTLTAFSTTLALSIWDVLETAILTASSIGLKVKNNLDAVLTARTLPSASYFDPTADTVATVTAVTNDVGITQAGADKAWSTAARTLTGFSTALALSIWDVLESAIVTASSIGLKVKNNLNATVSSRMAEASINTTGGAVDTVTAVTNDVGITQAAADKVWSTVTRTLTALGFNLSASDFDAGAIDANALATDAVNEIRDAILPTQNAVLDNIEFLFVAASDHVTPVTGATGTAVTRSIDGGAFGSGTGTLAEVANGIYQYDASAADMNGGVITFRFTGTGGTPGAPDDAFLTIVTGGGV